MTIAADGKVLETRQIIAIEDFKIGAPVRSLSLSRLAHVAHWVRGRGRCLVPQHACNTTLGAAASATHHYKVRPGGEAIVRVWIAETRASSAYGTYTVQAGAGPTSQTYVAGFGSGGSDAPLIYFETATKTSTVTDLTFTFTTIVGGGTLLTLGCWELPRAALARAGTDLGISLDTFGPRRPLYENTANGEGPTSLATLVAALTTKRGTLVAQWFNAGLSTTSATFVDCLELALPIVPSRDKAADTTRSCLVDVYASVSVAGTTGEARVVDAAAAASSAITINSTTPAWLGTVTKTFKCEDLSTSNGLQGGTADTVQAQIRRTAGAGSVKLQGFVVYE